MEIDPAELVLPFLLAIGASVAVGLFVALRLADGKPILPFERRRRVPWSGIHVVLVFLAYIVLAITLSAADQLLFDVKLDATAAPAPGAEQYEEAVHPLVVLVDADGSAGALLLVFVSGVLVAAIVEEFFFRLMLQGWLESAGDPVRRRMAVLGKLLPGVMPIVFTSVLFGAIHYPTEPPPSDPDVLCHRFAVDSVAKVLTLGLALLLLKSTTRATARDLGFVPGKLGSDVALGLMAFLGLAAPLYAVQFVLLGLTGGSPIVAPISLTLFALMLGTLYCRTHRIVPSIVLHMALNATSLAMAWWYLAPS